MSGVEEEFRAMTDKLEQDVLFTVTLAWPGGARTLRFTWDDLHDLTWYVCGIIVGLRLARKD